MANSLQSITTKLKTEIEKRPYVKSSHRDGYNWHRIWSDGLIEQGGRIQCNDWTVVGLSTPMSDTNYMVLVTCWDTNPDGKVPSSTVHNLTTTTFQACTWMTETHKATTEYVSWYVRGY